MRKKSKSYRSVLKEHPNLGEPTSVLESIALLKKMKLVKFDPTVDLAVNLGVDPRHADQNVRGAVVLPSGLGKTMRILVFAAGDKAKEAEEAGADYVGEQELIDKVQGGWFDFDVAIATPDLMGRVGRLGRLLAPRGLMPNPKVGTVTTDLTRAVNESKRGKVSFRVTKEGTIHAPVGKLSFEDQALESNIVEFLQALKRAKPSGAKGTYFKSAYLSSSMSPSVRLDLSILN
jgi:large subunit ribosomal protein L1